MEEDPQRHRALDLRQFQSAQRHWLGQRNSCGSHVGCIEMYLEQIGNLESYFAN